MTSDGVPQRTGNNLDPWYANYAERAAGFAASEVRACSPSRRGPKWSRSQAACRSSRRFRKSSSSRRWSASCATRGPVALQYGGGGAGVPPSLREHILEVMRLEGIRGASVDDVVTSTGSQQALDFVAKLFLDPGDVVLAEAPSYVGAMGVFRSYQASVVHVAMDDDGLVPDALRETIATCAARADASSSCTRSRTSTIRPA